MGSNFPSAENTFGAIVIGGGVAGLFCALQLTACGAKALVLEAQNRFGRKLLLSGGGKCNVTNRSVSPSNYIGESTNFCEFALSSFTPDMVLAFLDKHKITWEERDLGQIFCRRGAEELRDLLVALCEQQGATLFCGKKVTGIQKKSNIFAVKGENFAFNAPNLIIATGSPAWPKSGATDFGYAVAKQFAHTVMPARPALTPLTLAPSSKLLGMAGLSLPVNIFAHSKNPGEQKTFYSLPLLFTHSGISGPAALQASARMEAGKSIEINFLPNFFCEELFEQTGTGRLALASLLGRHLPAKLVKALVPQSLQSKKVAELSRQERNDISLAVHSHKETPLPPTFDRAEASTGGVSVLEVNPRTFESKKEKGLYFIGEVLDVCGELGGYNIHWAISSGCGLLV